MPRLAVFNMFFGFAVLFLAASAGAFIATSMTEGFLKDKAILESWMLLLQRSAHGHTNLFGMIHICFGLTLPYSLLTPRVKLAQTIGFVGGTLAMGPLLLVRGYLGPSEDFGFLEAMIGLFLSGALAALGSHAAGLGAKLMRRA